MDSGNTTWLLVSIALVLLMTPGLAFFDGGLVGLRTPIHAERLGIDIFEHAESAYMLQELAVRTRDHAAPAEVR